jgi:hypothetical protein
MPTLAVILLLAFPALTPYGETIRGVFRAWPKGDPAIEPTYQRRPQQKIGRRKIL